MSSFNVCPSKQLQIFTGLLINEWFKRMLYTYGDEYVYFLNPWTQEVN